MHVRPETGSATPGLSVTRSGPAGAKHRRTSRYRQAKHNEARRDGGRESEPIYEQDLLDCSYGFRPGRSAHAALASLWQQTMDLGGCWLVEVDVQKFFDALDHAPLRSLLRQRVRDGVLLRLIDKWLKAGVLEDGELTYPEAGTPQGGVVTPPTILRKR
jgi:Reverse transcriptase (RNA-dependent DNA polymerase)